MDICPEYWTFFDHFISFINNILFAFLQRNLKINNFNISFKTEPRKLEQKENSN